jgi:hypothetical protein
MYISETEKGAENLKRLHAIHVARYSARLRKAEAGIPGFRVDELRRLLGVWQSIERKGFHWPALSQDEWAEATDAILDERG